MGKEDSANSTVAAHVKDAVWRTCVRAWWIDYLAAFRNITRQYRRSLMGIAAVAFGVMSLILAGGFIEWIF